MISITIKYKLAGDAEWKSLNLLPEDYYFSEQELPLSIDSVPKYDHAIDYISDLNLNNLQASEIKITDTESDESIAITETFWNNGRNRVIERIDTGKASYAETIIQSEISSQPAVLEVIRFVRIDQLMVPVYHGFIEDNSDGSQSERKIELNELDHRSVPAT